MADQRNGGIAWTDETWNAVRGCSVVSSACKFCYAARQAARFSGKGQPYEGLARMTDAGPRWTGEVRLVPEHLADPVRWKRPRRIFVNSMSDLFHEKLDDLDIARVFGAMALAQHHTFQILTKRPERMLRWPTEDLDAVEHDPNGFREEHQGAEVRVRLRDPKGADPSEWPEDLRVQEFPHA